MDNAPLLMQALEKKEEPVHDDTPKAINCLLILTALAATLFGFALGVFAMRFL